RAASVSSRGTPVPVAVFSATSPVAGTGGALAAEMLGIRPRTLGGGTAALGGGAAAALAALGAAAALAALGAAAALAALGAAAALAALGRGAAAAAELGAGAGGRDEVDVLGSAR